MKKLEAVVALTPAKVRELQLSLDHVQPDIITWNEFVEWFQLQVEVRDQVHNAQLFQLGQTRLVPGKTCALWNRRVIPMIQHIIPISIPNYDLLFVGFENRLACFFN